MERTTPRKPKHRCAFVLDEAPSALGYIEAIAQATPVMSGYGVELIFVTQGIQMMRKAYPDDYKELPGNAEFVYWMGLNDPESPRLLQDTLGTRRRTERVKSGWFSKTSDRFQAAEHPLMDAEQIRRFPNPKSGRMIVTRFAGRPIKATNVPVYSNLPIWTHDPDPDWSESAPRSLARRCYRHLTAPQPTPKQIKPASGGRA
jgi:type IV secretory pathway TraG/TraD family ATPase VirD4